MISDGVPPDRYGTFFVDSMQLALPVEALREVVPCVGLCAMPCGAPSVVGAISLRGLVVPVVDLRRALGLPASAAPSTCVVIMVHQDRLLGLLASGVAGLVECPPDGLSRMEENHLARPVMSAAFRRSDDGELVAVLSPDGLAGLPQVPMTMDPTRRGGRDAAWQPLVDAGARAAESNLVLMRCGPIPFGLASNAVHTTVLHPTVAPSVMAGGYCRGVVEFDGLEIPAVDLAEFCGLGRLDPDAPAQAVLIRYPLGLIAFMVEVIVDVVRADTGQAVPLPPRTLTRPELFVGALPAEGLPEHVRAAATAALGYVFLLDADVLGSASELAALSVLNVPVAGAATPVGSTLANDDETLGDRCQMLTYDLGCEVATPMEQVAEILPWSDGCAILGADGYASGLLVSRGRAIPVFPLAGLIGLDVAAQAAPTSILVIEDAGRHIGFSVARLMTIDHALRSKLAAGEAGQPTQRVQPRDLGSHFPMVAVGSGDAERLLSIVDLKRIARVAQGRPDSRAPEALAPPANAVPVSAGAVPGDAGDATPPSKGLPRSIVGKPPSAAQPAPATA